MKQTAWAPANIAFTKFWGWRDEALVLPYHDTISMTLSACGTVTTVAPAEGGADEITLLGPAALADGAPASSALPITDEFRARVAGQLDFLRGLAGNRAPLRVVSANTMPMGTGAASSASGFAALTVATAAALGLEADERTLSIWARRSGSGSAARSIPAGFVRWYAGLREDGLDSYAESLFPPDHWALADVLAVVETAPKAVPSRDGHLRAPTSPRFLDRLDAMPGRNDFVMRALRQRDLESLGAALEEEAFSLHEICETSLPPVTYLTAATEAVLKKIRTLRREGLAAWFTLDAGPNIHLITESANANAVCDALRAMPEVRALMVSAPCEGAKLHDQHLF